MMMMITDSLLETQLKSSKPLTATSRSSVSFCVFTLLVLFASLSSLNINPSLLIDKDGRNVIYVLRVIRRSSTNEMFTIKDKLKTEL